MLWLTAAYVGNFVGTQGALRGLGTLYFTARKPGWAPPAWLFSPMWTVLYGLLGFAAWRLWKAEGRDTAALSLWWVVLGLSALWPWMFFAWGKLGPSFGLTLALWMVLLMAVVAFSRKDAKAAWLLVPSLAWYGYVALVSGAIWRMN